MTLLWFEIEVGSPEVEGWYRVMVHGDSEYIDGHRMYAFGDYEQWAYWEPAKPEEYEDFDGGYKGRWIADGDEGDFIFAYCGPVPKIPPYKENANV